MLFKVAAILYKALLIENAKGLSLLALYLP